MSTKKKCSPELHLQLNSDNEITNRKTYPITDLIAGRAEALATLKYVDERDSADDRISNQSRSRSSYVMIDDATGPQVVLEEPTPTDSELLSVRPRSQNYGSCGEHGTISKPMTATEVIVNPMYLHENWESRLEEGNINDRLPCLSPSSSPPPRSPRPDRFPISKRMMCVLGSLTAVAFTAILVGALVLKK